MLFHFRNVYLTCSAIRRGSVARGEAYYDRLHLHRREQETCRYETSVLWPESSHIHDCHYIRCIVEDRALYGVAAVAVMYQEEFQEFCI